jgi:spermine oxidase
MKILECETLIVGAGMSGVAASINLLEHAYDDFLVVEASDRIGGRCHTVEYGIDLLN